MTVCKPIDYEALRDELMKHYLCSEYYLATKAQTKYVTSKVTATTIDEYIKFLSEGYINVEIRDELDKYLDELVENEWLHQWPLVRLEYASRSLSKKTNVDYSKLKKHEENVDREIEIIDLLAKEGWPNAMAMIGKHYYIYGGSSKHTYESYICLCIYASRKKHPAARWCLHSEFVSGKYEQLCEEIQMFILEEVSDWLLERNDATLDDYIEKFDKWDLKNYKKMSKRLKILKKGRFRKNLYEGNCR